MELLLQELVEPFERMTPAAASTAIHEHYGLVPTSVETLDTERDDSFRVRTADRDFVFKLAHPGDDPALIEMQSAAMVHAAAHGLPVQHVIPSLSGELHPVLDGRIARLLNWIDGELLEPTASPKRLRECGAMLARLAAALRDFDPPAAHRTFAWDLQTFGELQGSAQSPSLDAVFERMAKVELNGLPHQVIHNDFHPGNVLVDQDGSVTGILDFGDMLHSARIADLAVPLAYLLPESGDPWASAAAFVDGYESITPLLPEEKAVLPDLLAARLAQRIIIPTALAGGRGDILATVERTRRTLDNLLDDLTRKA